MIIGDILITGGSGGIGSAIIKDLLSYDINIYNLDRMDSNIQSTRIFNFNVDFSQKNSYREILTNLKSSNKILNFIHCAGYGGPFVNITKLTEDDWGKVLAINYESIYYILKEFLPFWKDNSYGRFLGIASSLSLVGAENSVAYSGAKHAVLGFSKSIAAEWGRYGITANCLSPGYVDTAMGVQETEVSDHRKKILEMTPSKKIAKPDEISRVALFLISKESSYINGSNWTVDGGITAI